MDFVIIIGVICAFVYFSKRLRRVEEDIKRHENYMHLSELLKKGNYRRDASGGGQ